MGLGTAVSDALQGQRGNLFPWVPVFLGAGIGAYFSLKTEPGTAAITALGCASLLLGACALLRRPMAFLCWVPALLAAGICLAFARTHLVAAPVLDFRYYGPVEGRVVTVDRSPTDALRLTLDQVRLDRAAPEDTPAQVRVSLKGQADIPPPGARVMTTAHLLPPQGPAEPGGFDFRRHAWFKQLGGLGYTRVPVLLAEAPGEDKPVEQLRRSLAQYLQKQLPGEAGGFAAAVTAGDRSGVGEETLTALRQSNLAHLLAISGLHMGLLTGFVFAALRTLMCMVPWVALRWPVKKLAAVAALAAGAGYLLLSGGNVATERAFVMVAVMFGAVLLNRRAITLRAVAVAAVIVLLRRPESLLSPGFQMSFAATAALVAVFAALRDGQVPLGPRWLRPVLALVVSSAVAGAATAPFAAAHFNTIPHYGLLANLLSVPVMGTIVIPAAVLALCLAPLGLEWIGLTVMQWGLDWILMVASTVSGFDGAVSHVAAPVPWVLPLLAGGFVFAVAWQGRLRLAGLLPAAAAFALWTSSGRPDILIADSGGLIGVMEADGRALSRAKGQGFTAEIWLENDGDPATQPVAAARWEEGLDRIPVWQGAGYRLLHAPGKRKLAAVSGCNERDIIISTVPDDGNCLLLTPEVMRQTGSIAMTREGEILTAREAAGERPWTGWQPEGREIRRLRQLLSGAGGQ
ncbi:MULTISPECIES: ComEC/Rec2 family competence protein [unclassified Leisingera]|uniref:ComEC/Rec2 family competence protein n=1 Tax=unclassified Leisingera TaxID=2614906 RepID=UPI0002E50877|nr:MULTISPECIES: ComEC/Rec2 family competence protein [unclassified Leisingera]KIC25274.1 competence protein [Leisingera sp. ANG-S3]KIC54674.1 competence protein [Leisingera sp. ANG-S]KID10560.1 competence protein [Leisingera sp. ANG1]